ncbi:MAG TPA: hypothetical protein VLM89_03230 [Phycisphaerae bacterium]|nr:hypothetical protein [Phycisphaerae bacterium]
MRTFKTTILCFAALAGLWATAGRAEVLTLPEDRRPSWLARDGIVMAGSWEPLLFRVRRDGSDGYTPSPEQQAAYRREHSREMIDQLKAHGVNFVMMHCYKGAGLKAEKQSMADAVRFARLCRDAGVRVGVYNYSGAFLWELFFKEVPQAKDWILLGEDGKPILYGPYRYYWNRNHPRAVAFYRDLVRFAVEEVKTDLIHFDNYHYAAGFDEQSVTDFRRYLRETFTPDQLKQAGIEDIDDLRPPPARGPANLLQCAWQDFQCAYLARSYLEMSRYARSLRKDILMECNPMSVPRQTRPPVDHARILPGGEAFWDESYASGIKDGKLATRIRTYKVGRLMDNMAFSYITTPLEAAESMAFNHPDCLGCVCWFEYADIVVKPGSKDPMSPALEPYIRFYHSRRDLLRGAQVIADVAVLRSFPSQVFADDRKFGGVAATVEDELIARRIPFQIVHDPHLAELKRWPMLVLAGCVAMSDRQIEQIADYVRHGGKLCIVGPVATHDEWMRRREKPIFKGLPATAAARVDRPDDAVAAIRKLTGDAFSLTADAEGPLCAELTAQPDRRLVHLVNYDPASPIENVGVHVRVPAGRKAKVVLLADPEQDEDAVIPVNQNDDIVRFVVPRVSTYAVASVILN